MKKQFTGAFELKGIEYDYTAIIHSGEDAYIYPDEITDLDRIDREPIDEEIWEEVEFVALQNADLVEWCEKEGWKEEDVGNGNTMLSRSERGIITRIVGASVPVVPKSMCEPVVISQYDQDDKVLGKAKVLRGGINEWIVDPAVSRWSSYSKTIMKVLEKCGRPTVNPRWVEAFMSLEHPSLNGLGEESFEREVALAIKCIDFLGPEKSEQCAKSFGL